MSQSKGYSKHEGSPARHSRALTRAMEEVDEMDEADLEFLANYVSGKISQLESKKVFEAKKARRRLKQKINKHVEYTKKVKLVHTRIDHILTATD